MTDLDARVAALMVHVYKYRHAEVWRLNEAENRLYEAIRTELQKVALHKSVTGQQNIDALAEAMKNPGVQELCSVLQSQAKPAQEEITDADFSKGYTGGTCTGDHRGGTIRLNYETVAEADTVFEQIIKQIDAAIRASKGEKT